MVKNHNEVLYKNEQIETQRLILRKFKISDTADILEYGSDAETLEHVGWPGLSTLEEAQAIIYDRYMARNGLWAIQITDTGKVIGLINLHLNHDHDKVALGYMINRQYWGMGYASEALKAVLYLCFEGLRVNRVEAEHYTGNPASGRVMEKVGMKREGVTAKSHLVKGVFRDVVLYGITWDDYFRPAVLDL
ncbi:MAG: GNAT family N-acetyltransferase [Defluviitaleaceae bacterium]|nr:GNAT family N-acetyltransferase [Defluviitaleaceae bacterium]